jgi:hypothetical protein
VTDRDIDWRFPALSKQGCPDLTGRYLNAGGLFVLMTGGVVAPHEAATIQTVRPIPEGTVTFSVIRHEADTLKLVLSDDAGIEYLRGTLGGSQIGCYGGALIIRNVRNLPKAESAYGLVRYSELKIRKLADGNLRVARWSAERLRSNFTGKAMGPVRDVRENSWMFRSVGG